jgi:mono/diheme cytochrome c family protein
MKQSFKYWLELSALAWVALSLAACQQKMADQPRYKPLAKSEFFGDDRSARPAVEGTVARGALQTDELFYTGKIGGKEADVFPYPIGETMFRRGRERFDIYCAPCHDRTGRGEGLVVRRGFRPPPSLHIDRLRQAPVGHFFDVMTRGLGAMPDYAEQVNPQDRWAITAYIRALQLSQQARLSDLPENERRRLAETKR